MGVTEYESNIVTGLAIDFLGDVLGVVAGDGGGCSDGEGVPNAAVIMALPDVESVGVYMRQISQSLLDDSAFTATKWTQVGNHAVMALSQIFANNARQALTVVTFGSGQSTNLIGFL